MPAICYDRQSTYDPPATELRAMAADLGDYRDQFGPLAMVVRTNLHFGLANMLHAYCQSEGLTFGAFRSVDDALEWMREIRGEPKKQTRAENQG